MSQGWFAYAPMSSAVYVEGDPGPARGAPTGVAPGEPNPHRSPELADIARLARRGLKATVRAARAEERPTPARLLRAHLGEEAAEGAVTEQTWAAYEAVNVQVAVDAWLQRPGRTHRLVGIRGYNPEISLAGLLTPMDPNEAHVGNVATTNRPCGPTTSYPCIESGLYLVDDDDGPLAVFLRSAAPSFGRPQVSLEVLCADPSRTEEVVAQIRGIAVERNVFRGQVLSFTSAMFNPESVLTFHERPDVPREALILPPGVLATIERQVVGIARHREALSAAGQHLKRGLLLYGPPGVGKTHTVRYLMSSLPDTTVIMLTGDALQFIAEACSAARTLQPSIVVVEDVDLIAEDRGNYPGQHPLLFSLLNEMDGLGGDADVAFVLTTNRADLLESALTQRPGRIDEAVEVELPDLAARRALFDLYRGSLSIEANEAQVDATLERAQGVTASFLKEFLRRAALAAAERGAGAGGSPLAVTAADLQASMDDLLDTRRRMTRALLGGAQPGDEAASPPVGDMWDWPAAGGASGVLGPDADEPGGASAWPPHA